MATAPIPQTLQGDSDRLDELIGSLGILNLDRKHHMRDGKKVRAIRSLMRIESIVLDFDECVSRLKNGLRTSD